MSPHDVDIILFNSAIQMVIQFLNVFVYYYAYYTRINGLILWRVTGVIKVSSVPLGFFISVRIWRSWLERQCSDAAALKSI